MSQAYVFLYFFFFPKKAPYTAQVPVIRVFSSTQDLSDSTLSRQKTNYKTPSKLTVVSRSLSCLLCLGFLCSFPKRLDMSHNAQSVIFQTLKKCMYVKLGYYNYSIMTLLMRRAESQLSMTSGLKLKHLHIHLH